MRATSLNFFVVAETSDCGRWSGGPKQPSFGILARSRTESDRRLWAGDSAEAISLLQSVLNSPAWNRHFSLSPKLHNVEALVSTSWLPCSTFCFASVQNDLPCHRVALIHLDVHLAKCPLPVVSFQHCKIWGSGSYPLGPRSEEVPSLLISSRLWAALMYIAK